MCKRTFSKALHCYCFHTYLWFDKLLQHETMKTNIDKNYTNLTTLIKEWLRGLRHYN